MYRTILTPPPGGAVALYVPSSTEAAGYYYLCMSCACDDPHGLDVPEYPAGPEGPPVWQSPADLAYRHAEDDLAGCEGARHCVCGAALLAPLPEHARQAPGQPSQTELAGAAWVTNVAAHQPAYALRLALRLVRMRAAAVTALECLDDAISYGEAADDPGPDMRDRIQNWTEAHTGLSAAFGED